MVAFEILGPLRARDGDRELDLGPGKQRAVLAVLLLQAGHPVPTGRIVDAVWAGEPPANGPNVVQKYVAGLRRILEPDRSPRAPGQVLTLTDAGYLLRVSADEVDATRFERLIRQAQVARTDGRVDAAAELLRTALDLWRSEPFPGLDSPFFDSARNRLVELHTSALETWCEWGLDLGRHQDLVVDLTRLVARFPVRERLRHLQMLALYRDGRQAEALAGFREIRSLLHDEYGLEPGEQLQELHRRILRSDPALALAAPQPAEVRTDQPPPDPEPADDTPPTVVSGDVVPAVVDGDMVPAVADGDAASAVADGDVVPAVADGDAASAVADGDVADGAVSVVDGPDTGVSGGAPDGAGGAPDEKVPVVEVPVVEARPVFVPGPAPDRAGTATVAGPPLPLEPDWGDGWRPGGEVRSPLWISHLGTVAGGLIVLASLGLLTWVVMTVFAIRRRSWPLGLSAVGHLVVALFFCVTMGSGDPNEPKPVDYVMLALMGAGWLGGLIQVVLLNRGLRAAMRGEPTGTRRHRERRLQREQARYLLYHYPAARTELRIGRPDLPRRFDDGGLIDLNEVSEQIVLRLPGISAAQGRQIVVDRSLRGPYASMEELVSRCALPLTVTESLREILLFLPPGSPAGPVYGWPSDAPSPGPSRYARPGAGDPLAR